MQEERKIQKQQKQRLEATTHAPRMRRDLRLDNDLVKKAIVASGDERDDDVVPTPGLRASASHERSEVLNTAARPAPTAAARDALRPQQTCGVNAIFRW